MIHVVYMIISWLFSFTCLFIKKSQLKPRVEVNFCLPYRDFPGASSVITAGLLVSCVGVLKASCEHSSEPHRSQYA